MKKQKHYFVIEENIKKSKMFELKVDIYSDNYVRFNQDSLKEHLEKKSFKKMLQNGLFKSKKVRNYNATTSIQRLVACLYGDITGMEIHHINKDRLDNRFINLVPLDSDTHAEINNLSGEELLRQGNLKHKEWVERINKQPRKTLSKNHLLIIEILSNSVTKTTKELHKQFKNKIKSIKVLRNIVKTFFYNEEFLTYLKDNKINI